MKFNFTKMWIFVIIGFSGCTSLRELTNSRPVGPKVFVTTSAFSDETFAELLQTKPTLNFRYSTSDDIVFISQNQEITRACKGAAEEAGYKVEFNKPDCSNCLDVYVAHKFDTSHWKGSAQSFCTSTAGQNTFNGVSYCSTWIPEGHTNDRWISVGLYKKGEKRPIHRIHTYSNGSLSSVIKVAREHCLAALSEFPDRFEDHQYRIEMKSPLGE